MPPIVSLLVLAFAVSLDGFGVGAMYGIRKIRIPLLSVTIISCFSGVVIYLAMQIGLIVSRFLSPHTASRAGAMILMGIGVWTLIRTIRQNSAKEDGEGQLEHAARERQPAMEQTVLQIRIKPLNLMIRIMKTPAEADVDRSGNISSSEAVLLGLALSLDAFGAGVGAALIGFSPILTSAVIAVASGTFVASGLKVGYLLSERSWMQKLSILPGIVLILMGIMKLLR